MIQEIEDGEYESDRLDTVTSRADEEKMPADDLEIYLAKAGKVRAKRPQRRMHVAENLLLGSRVLRQ